MKYDSRTAKEAIAVQSNEVITPLSNSSPTTPLFYMQ